MKPRVAIVCDWLTSFGGAERVIYALHKLFPNAPIYTSVYDDKNLPQFKDADVRTSFIQNLPFAKKKYQFYLSLLPYAFEEMDLNDYDIVISSAHSAAKGIITKPETLHISYCHSPMRYVWGNYHKYIKEYGLPRIFNGMMERRLHNIRIWDRMAADRVDHFIANSENVKNRIQKYYRRDSEVIYPLVDAKKFTVAKGEGQYFLAVGRLIPYKKFDLLVDTFNSISDPLVIVGEGRSFKELKKRANSNITFLGSVTDDELVEIYKEAKALIFPQNEDFGITPLEAMASGRPVIAFSEGGALETVVPGKTGLFFDEQTPQSLVAALTKFSGMKFSPTEIRKHAEKFDQKIFDQKIGDFVGKKWGEFRKANPQPQ